jgi:hypothetical protein
MFERLGNMSIDLMRCASGNLTIQPFSLQRETRAEAAKSDRWHYLFWSYRLWHSTIPHGCVPMKRLTVVSLACLLSACVSTPADLRPAHADKVANFPAAAADLSDCGHRAMEVMGSSYAHRLHARPDKREFFITTTRVSNVITRRQLVGLELRFIAQGQATMVEMREGLTGGWYLARKVWPLIERCSQQVATPPAASFTAPDPDRRSV